MEPASLSGPAGRESRVLTQSLNSLCPCRRPLPDCLQAPIRLRPSHAFRKAPAKGDW